ncbi:methyltransferase [bacterium]|nr:methyltransferase [bacterium]
MVSSLPDVATDRTTNSTLRFDTGSFRDRDSRVFAHHGKIYRALSSAALAHWESASQCEFWQQHLSAGSLISSQVIDATEAAALVGPPWAAVLQHPRLAWISYPYEWTFGMLQSAALLQLQILEDALASNITLKDATPYNIQFIGTRPIFIDVGSFTPYVPGTPWLAYRQFCQLFLYPLLLQAYRGCDFQAWLRGSLSGISPQQCRSLFSWTDLWRPGLLSHVWLHAAMERNIQVDSSTVSSQLRASGFTKDMVLQNVRGLRKLIQRLRWQPNRSRWSEYDRCSAPVRSDAAVKEELVQQITRQQRWSLVWDIGCNRGRYSRIASEQSDLVLAIDFDHLTVDTLYQELTQSGETGITPVVMNLADASPGWGWRGLERRRFEDRGQPDLILMLAVIHHLVLGENLLLDDVLDWIAERRAEVVLEFVDRDDPQVQTLLAHRAIEEPDYTRERFEAGVQSRFNLVARYDLPSGTRTLFHLSPRE